MKIHKYLVPVGGVILLLAIIMISCDKKLEISRDPINIKNDTSKPFIKVFLENSGSMDGYMCDGSQLKNAVYEYISDLSRHADSTSLYFINSGIIPYKKGLQSYIKDMTPETFHSAGGNTSNTDIEDLIDKVLATVNDTTVSIFISDCILDLPEKKATDFLERCEISIKESIIKNKKRVPTLSVEIFQLTSKFSGKFFSPNGEVETLDNVQRPYYIWIFGPQKCLANLNKNVPYSILNEYNLKGVISFSNKTESVYDVGNRSFTTGEMRPDNGFYLATLKVDLNSTLQPDAIVLDKSNYRFLNQSSEIESIIPIDKKVDQSEYTHIINLKIPKGVTVMQDNLVFNTPSKLPAWVSSSNDETGTNIKSNLDKTTGIKYLIQGVAKAYTDQQILTSFIFNLKRK